jgi:ABC-2 type transport system ATP-binding protein
MVRYIISMEGARAVNTMLYHLIDTQRPLIEIGHMTEASDSRPAIVIEGVSLSRGSRAVLNELNLSVSRGEVYALLGGNGAGKSTTIFTLLGFLKPESGVVCVADIDPAADAQAARRNIAYLPENVALYDQLSAYENIAYFMALAGTEPDHRAMDKALDAAGLEPETRGRRISGFSKGMRQKVAIAMAVLRNVPVLLLDEPTSGLDPRATAEFNTLVSRLKARGSAILMVTHDLLGAADCADRIGFLANGRIVEEIVPSEGMDVLALHHRYTDVAAA